MDNKLDFIVIDFETANFDRYSAIEVGLVRYVGGKAVDSMEALIKPPSNYFITEWTEKIHHLSYDDVKDCPTFDEVWSKQVMPFINKTPKLPLVAHNAMFDMSVIRGSCEYYGMDIPNIKYFDSLKIAKKVWPEDSHKLTDLGAKFNIEYNAHDALEDSYTCGKIILIAADLLQCDSVGSLLFNLHLCLSPLN